MGGAGLAERERGTMWDGDGSSGLLDAGTFRERLENSLAHAENSVSVLSAYLTKPGFDWLARWVPKDVGVTLGLRWRLADLVFGASSAEVFRLAAARGWPFLVNQQLHAKVWLIDDRLVFLGSANATAPGLALGAAANLEYGVEIAACSSDVLAIEKLLDDLNRVTPELFERLSSIVREVEGAALGEWPEEIARLLGAGARKQPLFVAECLFSRGSDVNVLLSGGAPVGAAVRHVLSVLGLSEGALSEVTDWRGVLGNAFTRTAIFAWLIDILHSTARAEAFFGELTRALHDSLVDDPRPYRSDVKRLVGNLLGWIQALRIPGLVVDQPSHSKRVSSIASRRHDRCGSLDKTVKVDNDPLLQ